MSISAEYVRVERDDYNRFLIRPESIDKFFGYIDPGNREYAEALRRQDRSLVLGTLWQAVYYLLTNEVGQDNRPGLLPEPNALGRSGVLAKAVFGGHPVKADDYNDVAWYLSPEDVFEIAAELVTRTPEVVRAVFDRTEHQEVQIYRQSAPSTWTGPDLDILVEFYSHLREFYLKASKEGNAVFVWIG